MLIIKQHNTKQIYIAPTIWVEDMEEEVVMAGSAGSKVDDTTNDDKNPTDPTVDPFGGAKSYFGFDEYEDEDE